MAEEIKKPIYENTKLDHCLKCGAEIYPEVGKNEFCQVCGTPIINTCTNNYCINVDNSIPVDAAFCPLCGSITLFSQYGLIKNSFIPEQGDEPF